MKVIMEEKESFMLRFLYHTVFGRICLKFFSSRFLSKICGLFLDSRFSKFLISGFIRKNKININEYYHENFKCFNDCFSRKIRENCRVIDEESSHLISPCDGLLSAYTIQDGLVIPVKQSEYSIFSLLQDEELAAKYQNGICLVFRLCVSHYHRYCYLDSGSKGLNHFISGKLHTVRPIALENRPVFVENSREYTVLDTKHFGNVLQMEVGALLVGKIKNHHEEYCFTKGEEKGMFLYGGSTIILLFEPNTISISDSFFEMTKKGKEIEVKMGEQIGERKSF